MVDAEVKLNRCGVVPERRHTICDELAILGRRLEDAAVAQPALASRLASVMTACTALADGIPPGSSRPIHRDFYHDQLLLAGDRLYLLDLDLFCMGDPALDIGNFVAHLTELSLRTHGNAAHFAGFERAVRSRFVELEGEDAGRRADVYALPTLARHIHISQTIPGRSHVTPALLEICERRLALGRGSSHIPA